MKQRPKPAKAIHPASGFGQATAKNARMGTSRIRRWFWPLVLGLTVLILAAGVRTVVRQRATRLRNGMDWAAISRASTSPASSVANLAPTLRESAAPSNVGATNRTAATNDGVALINQGNLLLDAGQIDRAITQYEAALKINPDDEEAHFNMGYAYTRLGRTNEAISAYEAALRSFPEYVEAHNNLGNLLVGLRRYDEAVQHFTAALKINPDYYTALNSLGRALASQGKTAEAITNFSRAVQLSTNYLEARFNLGMALLIVGKTDEAIAQFNEVLRQNPNFQPAAAALKRAREKQATEPK